MADKGKQQLSIQMLDLEKMRSKDEKSDNLNELIGKIITGHNEKKRKELKDELEKKYKNMPEEQVENLLKKVGYHWKSDFEEGYYSVKSYYSIISYSPNVLKEVLKIEKKMKHSHVILFFYHQHHSSRIFALTVGNGWRVVRPYTDGSFSSRIAQKVADPKKMIRLIRRCLFSKNTKEDLLYPGAYEMYRTSNLYFFIESLTCVLKEDSSLFKLIEEKSKRKNVRCWIQITTAGILKIGKKFGTADYPDILDQLAEIVGGLENDQFAGFHFLQQAPKPWARLDKWLVEDIFSRWQNQREQNVEIRHKNLEDYFLSDCFKIKMNKKSSYEQIGSSPPVIADILKKGEISACKDKEIFYETLKNIRFGYKNPTTTKLVSGPFIDFLEGPLYPSKSDHSESGDLEADDSKVGDSETDDLKVCDSEADDSKVNDSEADDSDASDSEADNSKVDDSKVGDSEDDDSKVSDSEADDSKVNDSEADDSKVNDSEADDSDADDSESGNAELDNSNTTYFKINKMWFIINADYFGLVLEDFGKLVNKHLIRGETDKAFLPRFWKGKETEEKPKENEKKNKSDGKKSVAPVEEERRRNKLEEEYNRLYLLEEPTENEGYIVLDQILPDKIESCDILKYTRDTVYLYHVKEKFDKTTREVTSQILNSATFIHASRNTNNPFPKYLNKLWVEATELSPDKSKQDWRIKVKGQLEALGENKFYELFRKKIIFVYAYVPNPKSTFLKALKAIHEGEIVDALFNAGYIQKDGKITSEIDSITVEDVKKSFKPEGITELDIEEICDKLQSCKLSETAISGSKPMEKEIVDALINAGYLHKDGNITSKFYSISKADFEKAFRPAGVTVKKVKEIYDKLSPRKFSGSTIAKLELLRLAQNLSELGFEFRICEICREESKSSAAGSSGTQKPKDDSECSAAGSSGTQHKRKTAPPKNKPSGSGTSRGKKQVEENTTGEK